MNYSNLFTLLFNPSSTDFKEAVEIINAVAADGQLDAMRPESSFNLLDFFEEMGECGTDETLYDVEGHTMHTALVHKTLLLASQTIQLTIENFLGGDSPLYVKVSGGCSDAYIYLVAANMTTDEALIKRCNEAGVSIVELAKLVTEKHKHTLAKMHVWAGFFSDFLKD